jgi:hypothetical protein
MEYILPERIVILVFDYVPLNLVVCEKCMLKEPYSAEDDFFYSI